MRRNLLAGVAAVLAFAACDNTLDVTAPWEETPVLFALLNPTEDTNYVRIGRAYLGSEGPDGGAQQPDSLYYTNLTVVVEALGPNGQLRATYTLPEASEVVLNTNGPFVPTGYKAYRLVGNLNEDFTYRVKAFKENQTEPLLVATTPLVKPSTWVLREPSPVGGALVRIPIGSKNGAKFRWDQAVNARMYPGFLRFRWTETVEGGDLADSIRYSVDYPLPTLLGNNLLGNDEINTAVGYQDFYDFLANTPALPVKPGVLRWFRGIDLHLVAGSDDLATYISVSQPSNSIVQDKPFFTNVQGGAGVFASRATYVRPYLNISNNSLDSLVYSRKTCKLRFAKTTVFDTLTCN